jgi:uncharacterized protein DUF2019
MHEPSYDDTLALYARAAAAHGRATESGNYNAANSSANEITAAYRQLRKCGVPGQNALKELLSHEDRGIRLWAATHALEFAPREAERVLNSLALNKGTLVSVSAEMTLSQWRAGRLKLPPW